MTDTLDTHEEVGQEHEDGKAVDEPTLESVARKAGWKPKEDMEFEPRRGWLGPAEYLEAQSSKLHEARTVAERARDEAKRVGAHSERMMERARAEERERLEADLKRHEEDGDTAAAVEAARKLERASVPQPQPEVAAWVARNPWFNASPEAQVVAQAVAQREANAGKSIGEQLEAAEAEARKRFPELFTDAKRPEEPRREPPRTESGTRVATQPRTGPKGVADLSPEAKGALRSYLANAPAHLKEQRQKIWLETWFEDHQ